MVCYTWCEDSLIYLLNTLRFLKEYDSHRRVPQYIMMIITHDYHTLLKRWIFDKYFKFMVNKHNLNNYKNRIIQFISNVSKCFTFAMRALINKICCSIAIPINGRVNISWQLTFNVSHYPWDDAFYKLTRISQMTYWQRVGQHAQISAFHLEVRR